MKHTPLRTIGFGLLVLSAILLTAGLYQFILPPQYRSIARVLAQPDTPAPTGAISRNASDTSFGAGHWTPTEFERLQSKVVLFQVISNLDLNRKWGEKYKEGELRTDLTYQLLKRQLEVRQPRNGPVIEIRVMSDDPTEAADIANGVAKAYQQYVEAGRGGPHVILGDTLEDRLASLDKEWMRAQERLRDIRKELGISVADRDVAEPVGLSESDRMFPYFRARNAVERYQKDIEFLSAGNLLERSEGRIVANRLPAIIAYAIADEQPLIACGRIAAIYSGLAIAVGAMGCLLLKRLKHVQEIQD